MRPVTLIALEDVTEARDALVHTRQRYHAAILTATERGASVDDIAQALDTKPHYIANTLRLHREGTCGCGGPIP